MTTPARRALEVCERKGAGYGAYAAACAFQDTPPAIPPRDAAHRDRRGRGPAPPAAQEHGWRFAQRDAGGPCRRPHPSSVAATARGWMGDASSEEALECLKSAVY